MRESEPVLRPCRALRRALGPAARVLALVLFLVSALILPGCGAGSKEPEAEVLTLAVLVVEGEALGELGQAYRNVAQLVQAEVDGEGGCARPGGKARLKVLVLPHGPDVESGLRALRQAVAQGAAAVIGGAVSRQALPMATLAEELQVPFISPGATHPDLVGSRAFVFRTPYSDAFQARALALLCRDGLGAKNAAVFFNRAEIYSSTLAQEFGRAFRALGGRMALEEDYVAGQKDLAGPLGRIAQARPDVLFLPGYHTEVPEQIRLVRSLGYRGEIVGPDGWDLLPSSFPAEMVGARFLVPWRPGAPQTAPSERFIMRYTAAFGRQPTSVDALTYDAFGLVLRAASQARGLDAQSLRRELARTGEYSGVVGRGLFHDGTPERDALVMQITSRGVLYERTITAESIAGR